jgi:SSS family transporter
MPHQLATIDVLIVIVYVVGTAALGAWFARKQAGITSYFVGDRDVAWWLVLASIVATETSTVTFLSIPGLAFNREGGNLTFLQLPLGYLLGRIVIAWFLLPQYFKGEVLSAYQILRQRFDVSVQRIASGLFVVTRSIADGLRLYLTALLLHQFTGWNVYASILVFGLITLAYTYLGGMQAVIWTDLVQLVIYLAGAGAAGWCILALVPGGWAGYVEIADTAGKFTWLNLSTDRTVAYSLWAGVIGGAVFSMASHGADQLMVQRYLCSRSLGQARFSLVLSGVVVLAQFLLFLLIGVGLYVLWQQGLLSIQEQTRNDEVFGAFIVRFLPPGIVGLVVAAVLAAAMSTVSSSLNSSAGAFVVDFYRPLRPNREERHYLFVSKSMTAFFGLIQMGVALVTIAIQGDRSVVDQVLTVAGFTTGMILGLFFLGSMARPVRSRSALIGVVVGFLTVCLVWLPLEQGPDGKARSFLAWPWYAPVGSLTTLLVALLVDRLMPRTEERPSHGSP